MLNKFISKQPTSWQICLLILSLSVLSTCEPVLMTQDVGHLIFQQNQYFLIYVYDQATPEVLEMFNGYCKERTNCAILNSTVQEYESVRKFIGKKGTQFFLILNVAFKKKYVLQIDTAKMTVNDLSNFQKRFEQQTLEPYYSSEPVPSQNSQVCTELVGKTFDQFLKEPAVLKVVYSYTKYEACSGCLPLLKDYMDLAQKMSNKDVLIFGYVDVFTNDIPKIPEPIVPHFYIYQGDQVVKEVAQSDFESLPDVIRSQVNRVMIDIQSHVDPEEESSSSEESEFEQNGL